MKKLLSLLLCLAMLLSLAVPVMAAETEEIVVFYTNDIHTYIDNHVGEGNENGLTYSKVAALKNSCENALLVDAGDHVQGTAYGGLDKGETIIKLMNAAGYDLATLGNHEFDYGMAGCKQVIQWAEYPYVSCNFYHEQDGVAGDNVLESYKLFAVAGKKIAFVGITTPETITSSAPAYFQDEKGNYIYGIAGGADGEDLYGAVQTAIDAAEAAGADYIIALGHLGIDPSSEPWRSTDVIANTTGLDAFIDGHSHSTVESQQVTDEDGETVLLTQTGSYLDAVGKLTISAEGITTELLSGEDLAELTPDAATKAIEDAWISEVDGLLGQVIGHSEVTFDNYDSEGNRLVRKQGTNTGDFAADALYYLFDNMDMDVDVAVMNGGGIRNKAVTGDLSYLTCKEIHTFGNVACLLTVTGQQLLDALEWGSYGLRADGTAENGSFLHVSGCRFTLDLTYDSTAQADEKEVWTGPPTGEYRVKNVEILNGDTGKYEPLDLEAEYNLAGYNYTLRDLGGGFAMLSGAENVLDYVMEDYMVLANYIQSFPVDENTGLPTITEGDGYSDVNGSGRITIITEKEDPCDGGEDCPSGEFGDLSADAWYHEAVDYAIAKGLMKGVGDGKFKPEEETSRAMVATMLWRLAGAPEGEDTMTFEDVEEGAWYTEAVRWAASGEIVKGYSEKRFAPGDEITREQLATMLYRYACYAGCDVKDSDAELSFDDAKEVSSWAEEAVKWACHKGLIIGRGNDILDPQGLATRAETAQILMRFLNL